MQGVTEYRCECGDLRMRFLLSRRFRRPKVVYLCHTCDRDHPIIAPRLARWEEWKANGGGQVV